MNKEESPKHQEVRLQAKCVAWFKTKHPDMAPLMFHPNNGAFLTGSPAERARRGHYLKLEGVTAGVPDLILLVPRGKYGALCLEMKWHDGALSRTQKDWRDAAERHGVKYVVIKPEKKEYDFLTFNDGADKFIKAVEAYLEGRE